MISDSGFFSNFPPERGPCVDYKRLSNWLI